MSLYMAPQLVKTPLDVDSATVATGTATLLDTEALIQGVSKVDRDVPIRVLQQVTVEEPSDSNKITMQSAVLLQRDDRPGERGTVNATVDPHRLRREFPADEGAMAYLGVFLADGAISQRGVDRALKLSWTLCDLDGGDRPNLDHVARALELRGTSSLEVAA